MKVLRLEGAPNYFGNVAVRVSNLVDWAQRAQVVIPPTEPLLFDYPAVHVDSLIEAIRRGVDTGEPGHLVRAAKWLLEAGASCDPQTSELIEANRDTRSAKNLLRSNIEGIFVPLLEKALAEGAFTQLDADSGISLTSSRGTGASEVGATDRQLILRILHELGLDPEALPAYAKGMSSPTKSRAKEVARLAGMSPEAFERAWKKLRERRQIS
jgi:hypothetical protein